MRYARAGGALLCVLVVAGGVTAEAAFAHNSRGAWTCSSTVPAKVELKCGQRVYYHGIGAVTWDRRHRLRPILIRAVFSGETLTLGQAQVTAQLRRMRDHLWMMKAGRRWMTEARIRLSPPKPAPPPSPPSIGHESLWLCIHSREGDWNAETGNGYHGGLQMTYGWDGRVSDAGQLSPYEQMAAAEAGYAEHGYSTSWLVGQWPNTAPPCLGLA